MANFLKKFFNYKFGIYLLLCVLIVIGSFYLWGFFSAKDSGSVRIAMNIWPGYSHHTFLALDKGFFKKEGVNVEVNLFDEYIDSLEGFKDGNYDAFFGVYADAVLLASKGYPVSVVYVADFSNGGDAIVSDKDITEFSDLVNGTIGVVEINSFSHLFVLSLLEKNGINEEDVKIVSMDGSDISRLLASGYIDAGHTFEPFQSEAVDNGYNLLATSADVPNSIVDVLVVRNDFIEKNPKAVMALVNGLFDAEEYMKENPDDSSSYISLRTGIDSLDLKEELKGIKILNREENEEIFTRGGSNSLYEKGDFILRFYLEHGVIDSGIDLNKVLDSRFV